MITQKLGQIALNSINATSPHPSVSERYQFINTRDVLNTLEASGFRVHQVHAAKRAGNNGYGAHIVRLHHVDARPVNISGSEVLPQILLRNSHNRSMRFGLIAGAFRYACANGLIFGGTGTNYSLTHVGTASDAALEIAARAPSIVQQSIDSMQLLSGVNLTSQDARFEFASKAYLIRFGEDSSKNEVELNARILLSSYRRVDDQTDLFTVYNRVQEKLIQGFRGRFVWNSESSQFDTTTAKKVSSVKELMRINVALFDLAKEYVR